MSGRWMGRWMDGWMEGSKSWFKDCFQQSKSNLFAPIYYNSCSEMCAVSELRKNGICFRRKGKTSNTNWSMNYKFDIICFISVKHLLKNVIHLLEQIRLQNNYAKSYVSIVEVYKGLKYL